MIAFSLETKIILRRQTSKDSEKKSIGELENSFSWKHSQEVVKRSGVANKETYYIGHPMITYALFLCYFLSLREVSFGVPSC